MSTYYKYDFVSPEATYARIKEEMRSYFDTGAVDDMMFPIWTDECLNRFAKSYLKIENAALVIENYKAELPSDFDSVREAWICSTTYSDPIQAPGAYYYQTDCRLTLIDDACSPCFNGNNNPLTCGSCDTEYRVTHKTTGSLMLSFVTKGLLKPGNYNASQQCGTDCPNLYSTSLDTFDIRDHKFITSFSSGTVFLVYYAKQLDSNGYPMIPDNLYVQAYIREYIKWQVYTQLLNLAGQENFQQMKYFAETAERKQAEAFLAVHAENRKRTPYDMIRDIKRSYNRNNRFRLR